MRLGDLAVLIDHIGNALRVLIFGAARGAVRDPDLALRVTEQREGKVELLRELAVLLDRVEADAEDLDVLRFVLLDRVPEPGTLERSAGCVGLRVEPEHDLHAAVIAELPALAEVIGHVEIGGLIANVEHGRTSCDLLPREA